MSAPQFGDIVLALRICDWLLEYCFDPINNAKAKYLEFKQDVIDLQQRLVHLLSELKKALLTIPDRSRYEDLKREIDALVGNFKSTLEECQSLLREYVKFDRRTGKASALDNLFWHRSTQKRVERLRSCLKAHTYKIYLIVEPIQFGLITSIHEIVNRNQQTLEQILRRLGPSVDVQIPQIPQTISENFVLAVGRDSPRPFDSLQDIPLIEGVDILCTHFRECTFKSTSNGIRSSIEEKLSLLKAHWLHEILSASLSRQPPQSYALLRQIVAQIGQGVERQYEYRRFAAWNENEFISLEKDAFAIWPMKPIIKPPDLTQPAELEKELADVELASTYTEQNERLLIFQAKDKVLRMVIVRTSQEGSAVTDRIQSFIDLRRDSFVPVYTVTGSREAPRQWNVNIADSKGGPVAHRFASRSDTHKVQKAFTGYDVAAYSESVFCAVTYKSRLRHNQFIGDGEVQMWCQPGSSFRIVPTLSPVPSQVASEITAVTTSSTYTVASILSQRHPDVVSVITTEMGEESVLVELPPPPVLVGFLKCSKGYYVWQTELEPHILISEERTLGRNSTERYRFAIRHRDSKKKITMRKLFAGNEDLESWNLCALWNKPPSGRKGRPAVETLQCASIALDFKSKDEAEEFVMKFKTIVGGRLNQIKAVKEIRKYTESEAHSKKPLSAAQASIRRVSTC